MTEPSRNEIEKRGREIDWKTVRVVAVGIIGGVVAATLEHTVGAGPTTTLMTGITGGAATAAATALFT